MTTTSIFVVLALLAVPVLEARVTPYIIGGRDAHIGAYPWQGSLQMRWLYSDADPLRGHTCGCALVSDTWVMTAAHCVGFGAGDLYVVMGLHRQGDRRTGAPKGYLISDIYSHPLWNQFTLQNDIALIHLSSSVTTNRYVQPVAMATPSANFDGQFCTITGWGVTTTGGGGRLATVLQEAEVRVLPVRECVRYWSNTGSSQVCVFIPNIKGSCTGDSGGPLTCGDVLVGVTSFGQRGCYTNTPSVYTRVSAHRAWIRSISGL